MESWLKEDIRNAEAFSFDFTTFGSDSDKNNITSTELIVNYAFEIIAIEVKGMLNIRGKI
jgi:hypothetical protein